MMDESSIPYELSIMENAENYRKELLARFEPFLGGKILEVGAGIGFLSELLDSRQQTQEFCIIEPDESCRKILKNRKLSARVHNGTISDLPNGTAFTSIVSTNVLEHIEDDRSEVMHYYNALTPGGYFCLFVPARQELYAPIDKQFGHFRRYTKKALCSMLRTTGFEIARCRYFNFPGYFLWLLSFVLLKKNDFNPTHVKLFDRLAFPWIARIEKLVPPPIGQSLLIIARKPE